MAVRADFNGIAFEVQPELSETRYEFKDYIEQQFDRPDKCHLDEDRWLIHLFMIGA